MKRTAKRHRSERRQKGQFMTPAGVAQSLVDRLEVSPHATLLEPSFGEGGFLLPMIERVMDARDGDRIEAFREVMRSNIYGVELDPDLYSATVAAIESRWGPLPADHNLHCGDYFRWSPPPSFAGFDFIVGNPPFGGTFDPEIEDSLDQRFGKYKGHKLKKETYSFFTAKGIEELASGGNLLFICSDTFLTINTMRGLRELLLDSGAVTVENLGSEFADTKQPMVVLELEAGRPASSAAIRGASLSRSAMEATQNLSWGITEEYATYFDGPTLGSFMVATGGMTIGRNEWFVRELDSDQAFTEPFEFEFYDEPITLKGELERARLNRLSPRLQARAIGEEAEGATRPAIRVRPLAEPRRMQVPHADYMPYNKACSDRLFAASRHVVYWAEEGRAVLTFKKSGPWYLRGVGGHPYFGREGITWQLVAPRINARFLPAGHILDSGAPCGFLREGVDRDELFVILGWLQTDLATRLLKTVINHTRNIQGKDIERLPYPHWLSGERRAEMAALVRSAVAHAMKGVPPSKELFDELNRLCAVPDSAERLLAA